MTELRIERSFDVPPETLFAFITQTNHLLEWWGPEGLHVPEHDLDFSKTGPWFSVMVNPEGQRYKVSGQVTSVNAPMSVGFTWGWHDETDLRGVESHVTLTVSQRDNGAHLVIEHRDLPNDEARDNHNQGWSSSLIKLERLTH
ncbi:SRPBCC family protein [Cochlodiniinecator piscidefendens]|uniref:SRPBCC family protein n=1 Tax=Cochlodiniinecator piscidefendens TaxID=2715756 RepID=UPI00140CD186|nr:SRPBCC domain-containing protein [Cochlodiniinecator piscidefendens]